jgi:hypothetical protein
MNRQRLSRHEIAPWVVAALLALTAHWSAAGIKETVEAWIQGEEVERSVLIARGVFLLLFFVSVTCLYRMRNVLFASRTRYLRSEKPEQREHLILFLSNLDTERIAYSNGVPVGINLTGDLQKDLVSMVEWKRQAGRYWPWEMPLRAIKHHLPKLKTVTVICSPESVRQVHWFGQLLRRYLPELPMQVFSKGEDRPVIIECPKTPMKEGGWGFEDFDELSLAMLYLLGELRRKAITDDQIMIDFTGGQKVTSLVAASVTFNRAIKSQYIQTNPPYEPVGYDFVLESPETAGRGA